MNENGDFFIPVGLQYSRKGTNKNKKQSVRDSGYLDNKNGLKMHACKEN